MSARKFRKSLIKSIENQIDFWEKHQTENGYIELRPLIESQYQQLSSIAPQSALEYTWCLEV